MIRKNELIKVLYNLPHKILSQRLFAVQTVKLNDEVVSKIDPDWENALPYESIPGPSKLDVIFGFLPYGKYNKISRQELPIKLRNMYGDLVKIPGLFGKEDILLLFNPKYFEKIYRTEGIWPKRPVLETMLYHRNIKNPDLFKVGNLISAQGEKWGKFRSIVNPILMQPRTVRIYVQRMDQVASLFIDRIRKIRDPTSNEVPGTFERELNQWALESVCVVALDTRLGLIGDIDKNPDAKILIDAVEEIFTSPVELTLNPPFWKYIETPKFKDLMQAYDSLTSISKKYIDEAMKRFESNQNPDKTDIDKSIVERLVKIDKDVAVVMALEMFFAGVDTTTSALVGCLLNLAQNPDKQEKLRLEIKNVMPEKDTPLTEEKLKNLSYLRAVIKESLRMCPVVNETSRGTGENIVIENYRIPKGIDIVMTNATMYKDNNYFSQGEKFAPERWLRNNESVDSEGCPMAKKASNPFIFLPFGFGTRMCIGKRIVEMELEIALSKIVRNFHVQFNYPVDDIFQLKLIYKPTRELKFEFVDIN